MRCPKCGTENAPDSRFCGVCGAMQPTLSPQQQRLAPTAKIPDDAPIAAPTRPVQAVPQAGVSYAPPSMPPANALAPPGQAGLTTKPGGHSAPPRVSGEQQPVRPSGPYGQVQPRASSQAFDSVTPTAQNRKPTPIPGTAQRTPRPANNEPRPANSEPAFTSGHRPHGSNASMSFSETAPPRSLGLIAIVLVIDLGLAGAGAFLLAKGLAKPETKVEVKKNETKSEAPAPPPTTDPGAAAAAPAATGTTATPIEPAPGTAAAPATPAPATPPPAAPAPAAPATASQPAAARGTKKATTTPAPGPTTSPASGPTTSPSTAPSPGPTTSPSGPVTSPSGVVPVTAVPATVQPPSTQAEINALATRSAGGFARCKGEAALAGTIDIAFQVLADGTVANAAAVENTTGNAEVSGCLARVISGWRVSPFQGNAMSFVRSFSYP